MARTGFISTYNSQAILHPEGGQSRSLKAVIDAEAVEEHCLLACSACFLIAPRTKRHRADTAHRELGPPTLIQNMPTGLPMGQSCGAFSQLRFPLPRCLRQRLARTRTRTHVCKDFVVRELEQTEQLEARTTGCLHLYTFSLAGRHVALWWLTSSGPAHRPFSGCRRHSSDVF